MIVVIMIISILIVVVSIIVAVVSFLLDSSVSVTSVTFDLLKRPKVSTSPALAGW